MSSSGAPPPPEITAEWTVHAQLTLSHQGSSSHCDKPNNNADPEDPKSAADQNESDLSRSSAAPPPPVKVVYKFSTADSTAEGSCGGNNSPNAKGKVAGAAGAAGAAIFGDSTVDGSTVTTTTTTQSNDAVSPDKPPVKPPAASSSNNDDSGLSNTTSSASASERPTATTLTITPHLFPKCTSTCSIVLTADLHPGTPQTTSGDNATTTIVSKCASTSKVDKFTLFPEPPRVYEAKDASCQTSDIEAALDKLVRSSGDDLRKKGIAGDVVVPHTEKYNSLTRKSPLSTTADIISPSNTLQSQRSSQKDGAGGAGNRKKPRTVHIDVYCTGSDAESSSSSDAESSRSRSVSSSSSSGSRFDTSHFVELKSAAAAAAAASADASHPTVYESEEMKVRHKRAGKHEVPRRLLQQTVDQSTLSTIGSLKKAGSQNRKRCSTKEEINESKQILFSRILGEAPKEMTPFPEYLPRDPSDDNLSSNYPFSNRSTKRDITGSSLSSALASAGGDEVGDLDEATGGIVNLHRSGTTATHSDSFEYENSEDRFRIHEMERVWGKQSWKSPSVERKLLEIHNPQHHRRRNSESDNLSESDHSFVYDSPSRPGPSEPSNHSQAEFSDSSPSTVKSCPSPKSRTASNAKKILQQALLKAAGPPQTRVWSPVEGYSTEYLALARRFGSLITGKRKPGVHMGPVRNPECQCEHCRRWVIEREGGLRERALSVDDSPYNIVDMRRKYHLRNYQSSLAP